MQSLFLIDGSAELKMIWFIFLIVILVSAAYLIYSIILLFFPKRKSSKKHKPDRLSLERHKHNPIIKPQAHREWETVATFNPAVARDEDGIFHMFYRAIGQDGLSRIGYARSRDGVKFDDRTDYPVYVSVASRDPKERSQEYPQNYDSSIYVSGGGWGGCEDPRLVIIGDRAYMTYTAFEGWDCVRIVLTSIKTEDLKKKRWNWKRQRFISPMGEVNKNWVLFPEKINGKFAVLHSISPDIKIDYLDEIYEQPGKHIKSSPPSGGRPSHWDNWMRGAGAPPLRTDIGWLLLYHAMDKNDPDKYKLGCMILDISDPTRILYRSRGPLLEPDMPYENDMKSGVVYASGAVIDGEDLVVYYGGGDKYVCTAKTPLRPLLDWLVAHGKA